jgi:hypothetical protein
MTITYSTTNPVIISLSGLAGRVRRRSWSQGSGFLVYPNRVGYLRFTEYRTYLLF